MSKADMLYAIRHAARQRIFRIFAAQVFRTVSPATGFLHNWHLDAIAEYLVACERREIRRLIINMPPRYLKSVMVNVAWPAYLLGKNPTTRIISASYAQTLATKHAVDTRLVMQSQWYQECFPSLSLSKDQNEKEKFVTTQRGHRIAVSVGSAVTGEGGDFLIVDDPMNPQQVMHAPTRLATQEWFDHTFTTRLDDKKNGVIVVVMQRLHVEDLSGYLIERGGWEHLCLPAIAPKNHSIFIRDKVFVRTAGQVLHPEREDATMLKHMQREMGASAFAAQYQQAPVAQLHSMIRLVWFARYKVGEI